MTKPNCYQCKHRGEVPGSCHSSCDKGINGLFKSGVDMPQVEGNAHGIRKGWFMYPFDFDPIWLESCDSFEVKQ